MVVRIEASESLVYYNDQWEIAHPAAMSNKDFPCNECVSIGKIPSGSKGMDICPDCNGSGKITGDNVGIRLAWFRRDDSFICFDYDNPIVQELPK